MTASNLQHWVIEDDAKAKQIVQKSRYYCLFHAAKRFMVGA